MTADWWMRSMLWKKRTYETTDLQGIRYLWLESIGSSPQIQAIAPTAKDVWREFGPIVDRLAKHCVILCDGEAPDAIWAFACVRGATVDMIVVKRRFRETRREMLEDLVGHLIFQRCRYTFVIPDIVQELEEMPRAWVYDPWAVGKELG